MNLRTRKTMWFFIVFLLVMSGTILSGFAAFPMLRCPPGKTFKVIYNEIKKYKEKNGKYPQRFEDLFAGPMNKPIGTPDECVFYPELAYYNCQYEIRNGSPVVFNRRLRYNGPVYPPHYHKHISFRGYLHEPQIILSLMAGLMVGVPSAWVFTFGVREKEITRFKWINHVLKTIFFLSYLLISLFATAFLRMVYVAGSH